MFKKAGTEAGRKKIPILLIERNQRGKEHLEWNSSGDGCAGGLAMHCSERKKSGKNLQRLSGEMCDVQKGIKKK